MKKIILGLVAITSISAFAQVPPAFKIKIRTHQGWLESYSYFAKNIEDNGATTKFSGIFIDKVTGVSKRETKHFCKDHGYAGTVEGSESILTKDVFVIRQKMLVKGPNKILDSIECVNP
ncbi:MAG: hypothetical protein ACOYL6_08015 [Bacteriovoracaceae bacterium]